MNENILSCGSFNFKPRARLIKTIGEELISNDNVAITELVKNSYDAGSPIVDITFIGKVKERDSVVKKTRVSDVTKEKYIVSEGASIVVLDEGSGMDFEIIQKAWMEPATNYKKKAENKKNAIRKFTGEKGIGRFAAAKLSKRLELITKQKEKDEIVVEFDWNDFSNEESYLEDVKIDWTIRKPQEIKDSGTILKLVELNDDWNESKISDLRVALSRLLNPIVPEEDFLISINLPADFEKSLSGLIERPDMLNRPNYVIKGKVSNEGRPQDVVFYSKIKNQEEKLALSENLFVANNKPYCVGPFSFEFKIWDRDKDNLNALSLEMASKSNSTVRNIKRDLDDLCGISIYRDNVRVLPYGNQNNDWVRLDIRRVNNPTLRLSNNQIVGFVSIGLDSNPLLNDQSNREGIVESQAFEGLKDCIKIILNEVEQRRYNERPREKDNSSLSSKSLFDKFSLSSLTEAIKEKLPEQKEVISLITQKDLEIQEAISKVQEIISRYRRLSTLGQLIDAILHDGNGLLNLIDLNSRLLLKEIDNEYVNKSEVKDLVHSLQTTRLEFAQLFKRMSPFGGRKRESPKKLILESVINNQFYLFKDELSRLSIDYVVPNSKHEIIIDEADIGIIFMNLIQNSIYWLGTIYGKRRIYVQIYDEEGLCILFSDNGPGIRKEIEQNVFDPYFSTKPDGIGLGLTIVGELISEYNGEFMLVNNEISTGACFKIKF
ncbi:MAG: ATP-binding protein [Paludibacteraceae bacterium]|nr:ATP-binding protein [Paludibacteraceae bacterium]